MLRKSSKKNFKLGSQKALLYDSNEFTEKLKEKIEEERLETELNQV